MLRTTAIYRLAPLALLLTALPAAWGEAPRTARQLQSLNGAWEFQRNPADAWKTVLVPASMQAHEGTNFHGLGWYRKTLAPIALLPGKRVLLQFDGAATEAEVWWDGQPLGTHLGAWTPFRLDVTDQLRRAAPGQTHELKVRLEEKVGHNTQGFLPIIAPHFGGLWQEVMLLTVPATYIDDLHVLAVGDPASDQWRIEAPIAGTPSAGATNLVARCRPRGEAHWTALTGTVRCASNSLSLQASFPHPRLWSPTEPNLYELELSLPGADGDQWTTRAAFRSVSTVGAEFRLNGQPLSIRGLLNWGFSPPRADPNPGEAAWRSEFAFARSHGFNLMKFCLWVPPRRCLELADELGVLTWMEYPTWHPNFTAQYREPLSAEFREFFAYDRNHPSIILRSLTCETGPSADLAVLRSLYDSAHALIPGALVEDDSSWIQWNRIHDFYDDHPYGNNHTWVKTLEGLKHYIAERELKPLVLGEAIAADTWVDQDALRARLGNDRPWWAPGVLDAASPWTARLSALAGSGSLAALRPDSLRYGLLMRKYQIEAFRREVPAGGYVVSVIRDIPKASMGLLDYLDRPKWTESDWAWQRDTMCLLQTAHDRRSFTAGEALGAELLLSHFGASPITAGELRVTLEPDQAGRTARQKLEEHSLPQAPGTLAKLADLAWRAPEVAVPTRFILRANLKTPDAEVLNAWPLWVLPRAAPTAGRGVSIHASVESSLRAALFPDCPSFPAEPGSQPTKVPFIEDRVVVAAQFDEPLAEFLEAGGNVLLLPNGQRHSLPLAAHWFLRGAPLVPDNARTQFVPHDLLVDLQAFDLAADVIPNVPCLEALDPILMLWDSHDAQTITTHGIIFETGAGRGRLLVSAARHAGTENAAGRWLLGELLNHLRSPGHPRHALSTEAWADLKSRLNPGQKNVSPMPVRPELEFLK